MSRKDRIVGIVKLFLLVCMMTIGFFFLFSFAWFVLGLPQTNWALWICFVLACLSEFGYVKWVVSYEEV